MMRGWDDSPSNQDDIQAIHSLQTELADLRSSIDRWRDAEQRLSSAYVRLRNLIPGALDTPTTPSPEEVWEITENALKVLLEENKILKEQLQEIYESSLEHKFR